MSLVSQGRRRAFSIRTALLLGLLLASAVPVAADTQAAAHPPVAGRSIAQPRPVDGASVVLTSLSGTVRIRAAHASRWSVLRGSQLLPVGEFVDARHGAVRVTSAYDDQGTSQSGTFTGSKFRVLQAPSPTPMTAVELVGGDFRRCAHAPASAHTSRVARKARRVVVRQLWGSDRGGHFSTYGSDAVATVRGTMWLTQDRCDGTVVQVKRGAVAVSALDSQAATLLTAGHSILTPPAPPAGLASGGESAPTPAAPPKPARSPSASGPDRTAPVPPALAGLSADVQRLVADPERQSDLMRPLTNAMGKPGPADGDALCAATAHTVQLLFDDVVGHPPVVAASDAESLLADVQSAVAPDGCAAPNASDLVDAGATLGVMDAVGGLPLDPSQLDAIEHRLHDVGTVLGHGQTAAACSQLTAMLGHVAAQAKEDKPALSSTPAAALQQQLTSLQTRLACA